MRTWTLSSPRCWSRHKGIPTRLPSSSSDQRLPARRTTGPISTFGTYFGVNHSLLVSGEEGSRSSRRPSNSCGRPAPDWSKPALAYAQTIWDETGEVEPVLAAARTISHDETAELYDGYLNDFYRSMKAWKMGNELAGRIECGRSLRYLGELVFALDGVRAPYPKEWHGKLGDLEPRILEVARTGAPHLQQELCVIVRDRAAQRGYSRVYEAWTGDIEHALSFDFT